MGWAAPRILSILNIITTVFLAVLLSQPLVIINPFSTSPFSAPSNESRIYFRLFKILAVLMLSVLTNYSKIAYKFIILAIYMVNFFIGWKKPPLPHFFQSFQTTLRDSLLVYFSISSILESEQGVNKHPEELNLFYFGVTMVLVALVVYFNETNRLVKHIPANIFSSRSLGKWYSALYCLIILMERSEISKNERVKLLYCIKSLVSMRIANSSLSKNGRGIMEDVEDILRSSNFYSYQKRTAPCSSKQCLSSLIDFSFFL